MADTSDYVETFRVIDTNHDGLISAAEFSQLMNALGDEITDDTAEQAVELMDTDGDGLVSLDEFASYFASRH